MIKVFAVDTSMPASTMVVQTSTSIRRSQKSTITFSSARSPILPCAVTMVASGTACRSSAATLSMSWTRLWT